MPKKKKAVEIRYEPAPGIEARSSGGFVEVFGLKGTFVYRPEKTLIFPNSELGKVLNALTQLEKVLYYKRVINEAGKNEIHK